MYKNGIYGAVIGDICGSKMEIYEMKHMKESPSQESIDKRLAYLDKKTPLFTPDLFYTDDTILTVALAEAVMKDKNYEKYIKNYGKNEISSVKKKGERNKFGKMFTEWCMGSDFRNSYGNGCAMRISPVAFASKSLAELDLNTLKATVCTHDHPEACKCALATARAIFFAKNNANKDEIKEIIEKTLDMKLDFNIKKLQKNYTFKVKAINSVPQALFIFLESNSFEDAIRKALSIGGDTDTIAAITGSVAGAFYGIDDELVADCKKYLNEDYMKVLSEANDYFNDINNEHEIW